MKKTLLCLLALLLLAACAAKSPAPAETAAPETQTAAPPAESEPETAPARETEPAPETETAPETKTAPEPETVPETEPETEPDDAALVPVLSYVPNAAVDLRYAGTDNFTGQVIYDSGEALLRYGTAKKLQAAETALEAAGYRLLIWDAYRPTAAQFRLWAICPNPVYVADPNKGFSRHSRGSAVDVSLLLSDGSPAEMPSDFDDFTARADRDYSDVSAAAGEHAALLEQAMTAAGFQPYSGEWWHYGDETSYDVIP